MRVDHVKVALVHRQVYRLANRAAAVVDRVGHIGQLDEVLEVVDGGVAPSLVQIAHKGRAVRRGKHRVFAADNHVVRRIARVLGELARCAGLHDGAAHAAGKAHPLAGDFGAGLAPNVQGLGVVTKVDADFLQDGVGIALDDGQVFGVQHFIEGNVARDEGRALRGATRAQGALGFASTGAAAGARGALGAVQGHSVIHGSSPNRSSLQACDEYPQCGKHSPTLVRHLLASKRHRACRHGIAPRRMANNPPGTGSTTIIACSLCHHKGIRHVPECL